MDLPSANPAKSSRTVVTGASGFIGRRVVQLLENDGHDVVSIVNPDDSSQSTQKRVPLDLAEEVELARVFSGSRYAVHLAARSGGVSVQARQPLETFIHNVQVTANVLRACLTAGVERLFLASSAVVYRPLERPIIESDPTLGLADGPSGYAWSKICDEVQSSWTSNDLELVVGRFTNVYGPGGGGRSTVIHDLLDRALVAGPQETLTVWGTGAAVRSFINVEDAARAVTIVTTRGLSGHAHNIDTGQGVTIADLAKSIRDLVDPSLQIKFDPTKPTGDPYRVLDPTRLNGLGFRPTVGLASGLAELVAWAKRRGPDHGPGAP